MVDDFFVEFYFLINNALLRFFQPRLQERYQDVVLFDIPSEFVMNILLLLDLFLNLRSHVFSYLFIVSGCLLFKYAVSVAQMESVIFVLLDAIFGLFLEFSEEVDRFLSGYISFLSCLESWHLIR